MSSHKRRRQEWDAELFDHLEYEFVGWDDEPVGYEGDPEEGIVYLDQVYTERDPTGRGFLEREWGYYGERE